MDKIVEQIKSVFNKTKLKYTYNEERRIFEFGMKIDGVVGNVRFFVFVHERKYIVYAVLNNYVQPAFYGKAAEFITRANYGLQNGNFEMDYTDGEIRYKSFVDVSNSAISDEVILNSILIPAMMMKRYGEDMLKVILGEETPEEGIQNAEAREEIDDAEVE